MSDYNLKLQLYAMQKYGYKLTEICSDEKFYKQYTKKELYSKQNEDVLLRLKNQYACECVPFKTYKKIFEECVKRGITTVYDIGACTGLQSAVIEYENLPLKYIAVEPSNIVQLHDYPTINQVYPFKISADKNSAAISNLCIGVLYTSDNILKNQAIEQIIKDFDHAILHLHKENNSILLKSIPNEKLENTSDIFYFDSSKNKTLVYEEELSK